MRTIPFGAGGFLAFAVALVACAAPSVDTIAILDVTVIPMTGEPPIPGATVLVRGERIEAVGPAAEVDVPRGAREVDGAGKYLIPGLIEMHAHLSKARASALGLFLVNGVTTVRDMGGDHAELLGWRREVRSGDRLGPRILMAGPFLESASNMERMRRDPPEDRVEPFERARIGVGSPEEARLIVDSLAALELDFLKIRTVQDHETYRALNEAAHAHGLKLVGHVTGLPPQLVLEAGQDGVEHSFYPPLDSLSRDERLAIWRRLAGGGVAVVPTLVTFANSVLASPERLRAVVSDSIREIEPRRRYLSRFLLLDWREQVLELPDEDTRGMFTQIFDGEVRDLREMHDAGVDLLVGSDVGILNIYPGSSVHEEMALFVERLGMTPAEVLERTTRKSAAFLGIADSVGTIAPGQIADLILLDANPLEDIRNVGRIASVFLRGAVYDSGRLDDVLAAVDTAHDQTVNDWLRQAAQEAPIQ